MSQSPPLQALQTLLYEALAEPIGLLVSCSDPRRLVQQLYRARAEAKDQDLAQLQFRASPFAEGELVIVKETIEAPIIDAFGSPEDQLNEL